MIDRKYLVCIRNSGSVFDLHILEKNGVVWTRPMPLWIHGKRLTRRWVEERILHEPYTVYKDYGFLYDQVPQESNEKLKNIFKIKKELREKIRGLGYGKDIINCYFL